MTLAASQPAGQVALSAYREWRRSRCDTDFVRFLRSSITDNTSVNMFVLHRTMRVVNKQSIRHALDPAEIAEAVLFELWLKAPEINTTIVGFLSRMIFRRVMDRVRRAARDLDLLELVPGEYFEQRAADEGAAEAEDGLAGEKCARPAADPWEVKLATALNELSEVERYVFMRHNFDGIELKQIAAELRALPNTVVQRHVRAKKNLRVELARLTLSA
ncbi:MAG: sigma-70 family RNA polymerase sigma factor [Candidatus Eisenbacteria bacterium]|uniref:Sigma-70 family RNA polymerase sigma factor n=1 Tax=Eiseniibacteriota bacterium TaxID=2212470 RepID=A0A849SSS3_UNCEI|nr:sigma-70 family RNA polymerase sigma factor [Candidatus Eisenbacteria bacterium]